VNEEDEKFANTNSLAKTASFLEKVTGCVEHICCASHSQKSHQKYGELKELKQSCKYKQVTSHSAAQATFWITPEKAMFRFKAISCIVT
jgi:hypothetical protein